MPTKPQTFNHHHLPPWEGWLWWSKSTGKGMGIRRKTRGLTGRYNQHTNNRKINNWKHIRIRSVTRLSRNPTAHCHHGHGGRWQEGRRKRENLTGTHHLRPNSHEKGIIPFMHAYNRFPNNSKIENRLKRKEGLPEKMRRQLAEGFFLLLGSSSSEKSHPTATQTMEVLMRGRTSRRRRGNQSLVGGQGLVAGS